MVREAAAGDAFVLDGLGADACLVVFRRLLIQEQTYTGARDGSSKPQQEPASESYR
jgi:hypothetical protein